MPGTTRTGSINGGGKGESDESDERITFWSVVAAFQTCGALLKPCEALTL